MALRQGVNFRFVTTYLGEVACAILWFKLVHGTFQPYQACYFVSRKLEDDNVDVVVVDIEGGNGNYLTPLGERL